DPVRSVASSTHAGAISRSSGTDSVSGRPRSAGARTQWGGAAQCVPAGSSNETTRLKQYGGSSRVHRPSTVITGFPGQTGYSGATGTLRSTGTRFASVIWPRLHQPTVVRALLPRLAPI